MQMGANIERALNDAEQEVYRMRPNELQGVPFNMNSGKQMNQVLFGEFGIKPIGQKGKSGDYSTKADNLEIWAAEGHAIVRQILRYREMSTLHGTFIVSMGKAINDKGRIHARFNIIGTKTGRLSSAQPNLQNLPNNKEFPIRDCFEATPAHLSNTGKKKKLIVLDFSQIEYRVGAHLAQDHAMIDVYNKYGGDLHSETARSVWELVTPDGRNARDLSLKEVKQHFDTARRDAKSINFGIFYEMGDKTLATEINKKKALGEDKTTKDEATEIINAFKRRFRGVSQFMEWSHDYAINNGFVRTITGRKRHLPDAQLRCRTSEDNRRQSKAMRQAVNSQVQGSAADVMAIAIRNIRREFIERGWWEHAAMITNLVHDELTCEADEDIAEEVFDRLKWNMENAVKLRCDIVAEGNIADTWHAAK